MWTTRRRKIYPQDKNVSLNCWLNCPSTELIFLYFPLATTGMMGEGIVGTEDSDFHNLAPQKVKR